MKTLRQFGLREDDIQITAIRSQGSGGQHVNKVATAVHLRVDIKASSLSSFVKQRLLSYQDNHISKDGVINIKSQQRRSQEQNKLLALQSLLNILQSATVMQKRRIASRPTTSSKRKRLDNKNQRGQLKKYRRRVIPE